MSMSRGCVVIERFPGQWYCVVTIEEHDHSFQNGHLAFGPAEKWETAHRMMSDYVCNPGSVEVVSHECCGDYERNLLVTAINR